jgi:excisionase family DNA binding protein
MSAEFFRPTLSDLPLLTVDDAAAILRIRPQFVRTLVNRKELHGVRVGTFIRLRQEAIDAYLAGPSTAINGPDPRKDPTRNGRRPSGRPPREGRRA